MIEIAMIEIALKKIALMKIEFLKIALNKICGFRDTFHASNEAAQKLINCELHRVRT